MFESLGSVLLHLKLNAIKLNTHKACACSLTETIVSQPTNRISEGVEARKHPTSTRMLHADGWPSSL